MGERGKRHRGQYENSDSKNQKRRTERGRDREEKGNDEQVVYRILCPDGVIGSVIGKSGKVINSIRQESRAKVKVVDPFPGSKDRVIIVYCYVREKEDIEVDDEFNDIEPLCPAQDALLKVHAAIANALDAAGDSDRRKRDRDMEECQLLVPSSQSANIIGKSGVTIKKLRNRTRTNIKVTSKDAGDPSHSCAFEFDNFVRISGESEAVKKALFAISAIMYKFTPKENIPLDTTITDAPSSIIIPSDVPIYPVSGLYSSIDHIVTPRSVPSILGPPHAQGIPGYADSGSTWPVYSSDLPVVSGYGGKRRSEELLIKVLCPSNKIGRVIGKGGSSIKGIRQDSGARVDVEEPKSNQDERVIKVISTESLDDLKSMAVEAVLLLQSKINDEDGESITMRLLVPSKVIGCIIGRSGSIINEIRKRTKADVRISKGDKPRCADDEDELVEVFGELGSVRDALIQIVLRLRDDVLTDREGGRNSSAVTDSTYSGGASHYVPSVLPNVSSGSMLRYENRVESRSDPGLRPPYRYRSASMEDDGYRSLYPHSSSRYERLPPPSALEMLIPAHAVGKVMGKGGTNIENIRKISGADVEISDAKYSRGDRIAIISGTTEQKRSAENLIQAFIIST